MTTIREIVGSWAIPQNFKNQLEYYMADPEKGGWDLDEPPDADFYNLTDAHLKELGITAVRFRIRIMRYVRGRALAIQQQQQQKMAQDASSRSAPSAPVQRDDYSSSRSVSNLPPVERVPRDEVVYEQKSRSLPDRTDRTVENNITVQNPDTQSSQQNRNYPPPSQGYGTGYSGGYGGYGAGPYGYGGGYGGGFGRPPIVEVIEPVPVGMGYGLGGGLLGAEILGAEIGLGAGLLAEEAFIL